MYKKCNTTYGTHGTHHVTQNSNRRKKVVFLTYCAEKKIQAINRNLRMMAQAGTVDRCLVAEDDAAAGEGLALLLVRRQIYQWRHSVVSR